MPELILPFGEQGKGDMPREDLFQRGLYRRLPKPLQEACQRSAHLLEYLHLLPTEQAGIPQYHAQLSTNLWDLEERNLIYPVSDDVFIHVLSTEEERDLYIPIEPGVTQDVSEVMLQVDERLMDFTDEFTEVEGDEARKQVLLSCLDRICKTGNGHHQHSSLFGGLFGEKNNGAVVVTPKQLEAVKYLTVREKIGMGILQPMVDDRHIEDISCSGLGHIFVEHKIFRSLKSVASFYTHEDVDEFVLRLSERIKRPVTIRNPIVDAVLPDGSRINIVYGRDISQRGSNFSIRKFGETPLSILELVEFGSLDYRMVAYLSLVIEEGMNTFVIGEAASGKTTLLNAITTFIPPTAKVVSIEDTPELQVPHKNWIREVAKAMGRGEQGTEVTMFELLKAALRQRPNIIIIGEIRGEEGNIAFGAMQTGHAVMTTFHAASVQKLIQRLNGHPMDVPKSYIDNLNVVVIQGAVKLPSGRMGRRALSVNEIVAYDPTSSSFSFVEVFRWDPATDTFEFVGNKNSYILEQKIALMRGMPPHKRWQIYDVVERRARILEKLHKEKGVTNFYELLNVLGRAQQQGLF
jgi:flagellar protein FlaI